MRKFFIKIGVIISAAAGLLLWFQNDARVLAGARPLGMDDSSGWTAANTHNPDVMDTLEAANTSMLRVEIPWEMVEKSPGAFSWRFESAYGSIDLEQVFRRLQRRGIEPVAVLSGGPVYLSHLYPQQPVYRDQLLESFARFAHAAAEQFGEDVDYWQIGTVLNDPNSWGEMLFPGEKEPQAEPDPILYSEILQTTYHAIKDQDARSSILAGDLVFSADCSLHPNQYLRMLNEQGAWYAVDIVNIRIHVLDQAPESAIIDICANLPSHPSGIALADSIAVVSEQIEKLGEKTLWVQGLQFDTTLLAEHASIRSTIPEVISSDLLTRASALLRAYGRADRIFWTFDPLNNTPGLLALQTYANLSSSLGGRFDDSGLLESREAFILRFRGSGKLNMVAWYTQVGDDAQAMHINGLENYDMRAFSADSDSLKSKHGIHLPIKNDGSTALMVSERPVLISGHPADIKQTITQRVEESAAQASAGMQTKFNHWLQAKKAKAAAKLGGWVAEQQASLLNSLQTSLEDWLRERLGIV